MGIEVNGDSIIKIMLATNGLLSTCEFKSCGYIYMGSVCMVFFLGILYFVHKSYDCVLMHHIIII